MRSGGKAAVVALVAISLLVAGAAAGVAIGRGQTSPSALPAETASQPDESQPVAPPVAPPQASRPATPSDSEGIAPQPDPKPEPDPGPDEARRQPAQPSLGESSSPEAALVCPVGTVGWTYESVQYTESVTSVIRNLGIGNEYDVSASIRVLNSSNWTVHLNLLSVPIDYRTARISGSVPLSVPEITLRPGEERLMTTGSRNAVMVSGDETFDNNWSPARLTYPSTFSWVDSPRECSSGGPYNVTFVP